MIKKERIKHIAMDRGLSGKKILMTGADGFIGSHLYALLVFNLIKT